MGRNSTAAAAAGAAHFSSRTFLAADRMESASASKSGAMTTSVKMSAIWRARSAVTVPLVAITPPKADDGSQALALACASARSAPSAIPHGLECLMMATHGSAKS